MTTFQSVAVSMPERAAPTGSSDLGDRIFRHATRLFAILVLLVLGGIILLLIYGAWPAFEKFGPGFITKASWNPVTEQFGGLVPIYGTLVTSCVALLVGTPISFGLAFFLTELSPPFLKRPIGTCVELLAAVPSIIYGMWGLFVVAPFLASTVQPFLIDHLSNAAVIGPLFAAPPFRNALLSAGLILPPLILPLLSAGGSAR